MVFDNIVAVRHYCQSNLRRECVDEHMIAFVMDLIDEAYLVGHSDGMCGTCKKTGQVRTESPRDYDLKHPSPNNRWV